MASISYIAGVGAYLPENIISNHELATRVDTSDEWIVSRTGIRQRHIISPRQLTSDMAAEAARQAIQSAGIEAIAIDLVIVATTTPDNSFPSTATKVQALLGIKHGAAFDLQAVCAGFIYALATADNFIKCGQAKTALVIGADAMSRLVDWEDRASCVLFGDGAGAVILQAGDSDHHTSQVLSTHLYADGTYGNLLYTDGGVASTGTAGKLRMVGQEVFKHAVEKISDSVLAALAANHLTTNDIDLFIPHQANIRILTSVAKRLQLPIEKVALTLGEHANTSAASIPLALERMVQGNAIHKGDLVVMGAIGGGLCWGTAIARW